MKTATDIPTTMGTTRPAAIAALLSWRPPECEMIVVVEGFGGKGSEALGFAFDDPPPLLLLLLLELSSCGDIVNEREEAMTGPEPGVVSPS